VACAEEFCFFDLFFGSAELNFCPSLGCFGRCDLDFQGWWTFLGQHRGYTPLGSFAPMT
jgi:hypothetical protein